MANVTNLKKQYPPLCIFANDIGIQATGEVNYLFDVLNYYSKITTFKKYLIVPAELNSNILSVVTDKANIANFRVKKLPVTQSFSESINLFFERNIKFDSIIASDIYSVIIAENVLTRLVHGDRKLGILLVNAEKLDNYNWRLCVIDGQGSFKGWVDFYSKLMNGRVRGVLGVYYINRRITGSKFSLNYDFKSSDVDVVELDDKDYLSIRADKNASNNQQTIFCDLDGTLVEHDPYPDPEKPLIPLAPTKKFIDWIKDSNSKLVICTARNYDKSNFAEQLKSVGIVPFDIVMGCTSGQRILINDSKPRTIIRKGAYAINVKRNIGLSDFNHEISIDKNDEKLLAILDGRSGAHTWLIMNADGKRKVKKFLSNDSSDNLKRLKTQFYDLLAYSRLFPNCFLVPEILANADDKFCFYLDYYENTPPRYKSKANVVHHATIASEVLKNKFYRYATQVNLMDSIRIIRDEKVLPRLTWVEDMSADGKLSIRNEEINSIKKAIDFSVEIASNLKIITNAGIIHGDLTLENVLFGSHANIRLIDVQAEIGDAPWVSDYGKLLQSVLCRYESWGDLEVNWLNDLKQGIDEYVAETANTYDELINIWQKISGMDRNSLIYFSLLYLMFHMIRMIPYQCQSSYDRGQMAINAAVILSKSILRISKHDYFISSSR